MTFSPVGPRSRSRRWHLVGLIVAAGAVLGRWVVGGVLTSPVPAGLLLLAGAAALVFAVRRRVAALVGLGAAALTAGQLVYRVDPQRLTGAGGGLAAALLWLQIGGVVVALAAGIVHLIATRRRSGSTDAGAGVGAYPVQIIALLVLAPVCAEYLAAYDDSTGRPLPLLLGLVIFVPLYGCAALLVREVARRCGLGWVGIVLLGAAFGLFQAGVVDQSLFSADYRQIEGWEAGYAATLVAPLGISAANALNFVGGHAVFSISAPIGLIEATRPTSAGRPWLGRRGLVVVALVYAAGSGLVLKEHLATEADHASAGQVVASLLVFLGLVGAAFCLGRRQRSTVDRPASRTGVVLVASAVLAASQNLVAETWTGVAVTAVAYVLAGLGLGYASRRTGWGVRHVAAVCAGPLLVRAVWAFTYPPLVGAVSDQAKYAHNAVLLVVVLGLSLLALRPVRPRPAARVDGRSALRLRRW